MSFYIGMHTWQPTPLSRYTLFPAPQKVCTWPLPNGVTILLWFLSPPVRLPVLQLHINGLNSMDLLCQASFNTMCVKCIPVLQVSAVHRFYCCLVFIFIHPFYFVIEIHNLTPVDEHLACFFLKCFEWSCHEHLCTCHFSSLLLIWKTKSSLMQNVGFKQVHYFKEWESWLYINLKYVWIPYFTESKMPSVIRCHHYFM